MSYSAISSSQVESAIEKHGITAGRSQMIQVEHQHALESLESGLYITWMPIPSVTLTSAASDEVRSGVGQCCRIGSSSKCMCGHLLSNHEKVKTKSGYIKPPKCLKCKKCPAFSYAPSRPEECGQWWLPRRPDFNLSDWQQRVRSNPHEYACIGCEQRLDNHETLFESRQTRANRGGYVNEKYIPLSGENNLTDLVINGQAKVMDDLPVKAGITFITDSSSSHK